MQSSTNLAFADLVFNKDTHEILMLANVCPVVILRYPAVLTGRQREPQFDLPIHAGACRPPFKLVPFLVA